MAYHGNLEPFFNHRDDDGDDDDADSLFGSAVDDDLSSLFTEEAGPSSLAMPATDGHAQLLTPSPDSPEAAQPLFQLTFPSTTPTLTARPSCAPAVSLPPQPAEAAGLTFPTAPDPLSAILLPRDGHTSGGPVVSTQNFAQESLSSEPAPFDDAALEAQLEEMWMTLENEEQPVNTPAENSRSSNRSSLSNENHVAGDGEACRDDDIGLSLDQIPHFRYADCKTSSGIRLPYRVDGSLRDAERLAPYITFSKLLTPLTVLLLSIGVIANPR